MNIAQLFSLVRAGMSIGGTAIGVHAAMSPDWSTLTVALGALGPVASIVWSLVTHAKAN